MPDQQQQINYGAAPNDGQGDPLRDAFIKTDDNFDAIWAAGPVGSNVTIFNNTVAVVNTNGNLVLRPNGVGVIQANASIVPDSANIRDLGAADRRWRRVYLQTLNTIDYEVDGDLTVSGNLTIQGDTIQIGNLVTDAKTLQLSNTAANAAQATGSGITVGAADNIATLLYNSSTDTWDTNIGFAVSGNVTADYFIGNGSALSGLPAPYTDSDVTALLSSGNVSTDIFTQGNIEAAYILGNGSQLTGLPEQYGNSNVTTLLANFGSNAIVTTGNIEAGKLDVQNGIGNAWTIYGQRIFAPSGGEWRSEEDSGDDFITSANDGYINLQSLYADGNIASELHLEHGTAHIRIADGPFDDWYFLSGGTMTTPGHIIPQANGMYSLGNATNQWANLWVANNTIYLGGVAIGVTGNTLTVAGEPVLSNDSDSDVTTTGNITAGIMSADYVQFLDSGSVTESYISETGFIVGSNNSATLATLQAEDVRIITDFNGNGATWTFGANGDLGAPGSINAPGNIAAGNILTDNYLYANGAPFVSASTGNITFTDTTMSPPDGVDITISAANSEVVIEAFDIRLDATDDLRLTGNDIVSLRNRSTTDPITIRTDYDNNDYGWEFAADGTLTTPGDIVTAGDVTGTAGASTLYFKAQPASNTYIQLNNSVDSVISTVANLEVRTDVSNTAQVWSFNTTGNLTAPGNITANGNVSADRVLTNSLLSETDVFVQALDGLVDIRANGNVVIKSADANYEWLFDDAGVLTTPGDIVVNGGLELSAGIVTTATNSSLQAANGGLLSLSSTDSNTTSESAVRAYVDTADNANNRVYIYTDNQGTGDLGTWTFAPDGTLTLPGDTAFMDASANFVGIYPDASQNNGIELYTTATEIFNTGNVNVVANVAGTAKTWTFANTGDLTAPGAISATGNITGGNLTTGGAISFPGQGVLSYKVGNSIAFGYQAARTNQEGNTIAVGFQAGDNTQREYSIALGYRAGGFQQGSYSVGIGTEAGHSQQGGQSVAIGWRAGYQNQSGNSVAIGLNAGANNQGNCSIAIGRSAGRTDQANNSIVINATGSNLDVTTANIFVVAPVRNVSSDNILQYNTTTNEISYSNTISITGNITAGNINANVAGYEIGYKIIPPASFPGNTTLSLADSGKGYYLTLGGSTYSLTIPSNANVAFPIGTAVSITMATGNLQVLTQADVNLYLAGNSSAGNRTVSDYGMATLIKVATNNWMINGTGVS